MKEKNILVITDTKNGMIIIFTSMEILNNELALSPIPYKIPLQFLAYLACR